MSLDQQFFDPIPLSGGCELVTLQDAGRYITKLPKAEHDAPEWQGYWGRWVATTRQIVCRHAE